MSDLLKFEDDLLMIDMIDKEIIGDSKKVGFDFGEFYFGAILP